MDKQLETDLNTALQELRNAAIPLTDAQVRRMIAAIMQLASRIVAGNIEGSLPW